MFWLYFIVSLCTCFFTVLLVSFLSFTIQFGRIKHRVFGAGLRYPKYIPVIASLVSNPNKLREMISKWNKMIYFQPDVFDNMEIIFVENLTDNEGNICEGIARIHYRFFCWFPVKVIMINYDYVKNMTELDNLNRLIVHEYIHHWLYLNYSKWDKLHVMFEMWEHKER